MPDATAEPPVPEGQQRWMRRAAAAAGHLGLALLVTAPLVLHPLSRLPGDGDLDVWNHAWGPWWWWTTLSSGTLPWRTDLLAYPAGGVLWFIDPVLALAGAPLVPVLGAIGAYSAVVVGYVAFASWAAGRLARALGASPWARWVASAAFAASAWMLCEVHNGISEAFDIGFVALAAAWVEEATRDPDGKRWARAGLGVGLAAVASPYLGLGAGVYAAVRGLPAVKHAWLGAVVAVAVASPPALLLRAQLQSDDAIIKHPESMNDQLALHNAVDPRTFVQPFGFRSVDLSAEGFEHSMYLGLAALALALVGAATFLRGRGDGWRPRVRSSSVWIGLAVLVSIVCALGPYLYWGDGWLTVEARRIRLPWWALQRLAPGLAVTHPLRLAVPALAAVAGLAAVGADRLLPGKRSLIAAGIVLLDGLLIAGAPWPAETAAATAPPAVAALTLPPGEAPVANVILDLPTDVGATMATSRYLFWQTAHHRAIPYGPDARASTSPLIHDNGFRAFAALSSRRDDEQTVLGLSALEQTPDLRRLTRHGIRWVLVHHDLDPAAGARLESLLAAQLGPGTRTGDTSVWDLGEVVPPDKRSWQPVVDREGPKPTGQPDSAETNNPKAPGSRFAPRPGGGPQRQPSGGGQPVGSGPGDGAR